MPRGKSSEAEADGRGRGELARFSETWDDFDARQKTITERDGGFWKEVDR